MENIFTSLQSNKKVILVSGKLKDYVLMKDVYDSLVYYKMRVELILSEEIKKFQYEKVVNFDQFDTINNRDEYIWIFVSREDRDFFSNYDFSEEYVILCNIETLKKIEPGILVEGNSICCGVTYSDVNLILYGVNNRIEIDDSVAIGSNVKIELHNGSSLKLKGACKIGDNVKIIIYGDSNVVCYGCNIRDNSEISARYDCKVSIGEGTSLSANSLVFCKYGATLSIGECCTFETGNHIISETGSIVIGNDLMTSYNVDFICGDGHGIFDISTGRRTNACKKIEVGNHVWVGTKSTVLGGAAVGDDVIIGANSVVNKSIKGDNIVIAGNPAKEVKENIHWERYSLL